MSKHRKAAKAVMNSQEKQKPNLVKTVTNVTDNKTILEGETKEPNNINVEMTKMEEKLKKITAEVLEKQQSIEKKDAELKKITIQVDELKEKSDKVEAQLLDRENKIKERENAIAKKENDAALAIQQKQLIEKDKFEQKLAEEHTNALTEMQSQLENQRQKFDAALFKTEQSRLQDLEKQIKEKQNASDKEILEKLKAVEEKEKELQCKEKELIEREQKVILAGQTNERLQNRLEIKEEEINSLKTDLDNTIETAMKDKIENFQAQLDAKDDALKELRAKFVQLISEQEKIDNFKTAFGDNPIVIQDKMKHRDQQIEELTKELAKRAPAETEKELENLRKQCTDFSLTIEQLNKDNKELQKKNFELAGLETKNIGLESKKTELESLLKEVQGQNANYLERIKRLSSTEARLSDRDERVAEIKKGYLTDMLGKGLPNEASEITWLQNIYQQCDNFGIHFPKRILYAFHTALKISDWSSITVLAGVSGTGKSELPKLYAAFGGMNFINVPVQPSWDSQESMLGFFNSIDNRFDPEPLLRFLVQCTEDSDYSQYMSIVLLDEMNLAHVEHYFADFLSKLETRRGASKTKVPTIEVKLGAGVEPYELKLERSILWTGTMNQDETTKSLSDKVLDRGLVINFPRPRVLCSRKTMGILDKAIKDSKRPMLYRNTWGSWIIRTIELEGEQDKVLNKYKEIVESINNELEHVGRAIGHRVWQSIEYYIMNYPTVVAERLKLKNGDVSPILREAMKVAFEDQIVQKIMPKMRGVETHGMGSEYLERIKTLLVDNGFEHLKDDFEIACQQGYGQFIWSSAKYIEEDEAEEVAKTTAEIVSADKDVQYEESSLAEIAVKDEGKEENIKTKKKKN